MSSNTTISNVYYYGTVYYTYNQSGYSNNMGTSITVSADVSCSLSVSNSEILLFDFNISSSNHTYVTDVCCSGKFIGTNLVKDINYINRQPEYEEIVTIVNSNEDVDNTVFET